MWPSCFNCRLAAASSKHWQATAINAKTNGTSFAVNRSNWKILKTCVCPSLHPLSLHSGRMIQGIPAQRGNRMCSGPV